MIPRVIHYVWVGSPLPEQHQRTVDNWRRLHPGWKVVEWNERNIDFSDPVLRKAYDQRQWAKVSDIARLAIVASAGGIYLDIDVDLIKPLDPVLDHSCFYAFQQERRSQEWIGNAVFGAHAGNAFIVEALDRLRQLRPPLPLLDKPTIYGPRLITRLLFEKGLNAYGADGVSVGDVFLYPTRTFYPYHWTEQFNADKISNDTLGMHVWAETPSWHKEVGFLLRQGLSVRRKVRQLYNLALRT